MLTCQLVSREASEQFFKNTIISFRINHGVYQEGNGSNFGLCGFGAAWSPGSENVLGAFLRNARFMSLTLDCASIESHRNFGDVSIWSIPAPWSARLSYESDSDSSGRNPPRSLSSTGDEAFDKNILTLVNALKTARFLENIRFNIKADSKKMESLTVRGAIRGIKHLLQPFITLSHISWELKVLDFRGPQEYPGSGLDIFLDGLEGVKKLDLLHLDSLEEEIAAAEEDAREHGREPGYLHYYCRSHIRFDRIRVR
ncbi:Alcohol oxidase [Venturia inaequalis]|nr:Alcohol oxidase [Venturia inaequalis]